MGRKAVARQVFGDFITQADVILDDEDLRRRGRLGR